MLDLSQISYSSMTYVDNEGGLARANGTLVIAKETSCPGETFDLFHNGRGWVVRTFEDGEFVRVN